MKLYISHGAGTNPDWFIVEPRDSPEKQVEHLRKGGRTVYVIRARPWKHNRRMRQLAKLR